MELTFLGHSAIRITTGGATLLVDPFITGNPKAEAAGLSARDVTADFILLTHGHADHLGDTVEIAKRCSSKVIACFELASYLAAKGLEAIPHNPGGTYRAPWGWAKFTLAFHSSSFEEEGTLVYLGEPAGLLFQIEDKRIYHAGDTALFSDLRFYGEDHPVDLALLPIGDCFTMGIDDAVVAAKYLRAHAAMPIHYDTFPPIQADADRFARLCSDHGIEPKVLEAGQTLSL